MKTRFLAPIPLALAACVVTTTEQREGNPEQAQQAFELMKSFAGKWRGLAPEGDVLKPVEVSYEVVSGGTAVMERLFPGGASEMISIYHRDGDRLLMTHYCSEGNQPRMELTGFSAAPEPIASFAFVDATNWTGPDQLVMHDVRHCAIGKDKLSTTWTAWVGGKPDHTATVEFTRIP